MAILARTERVEEDNGRKGGEKDNAVDITAGVKVVKNGTVISPVCRRSEWMKKKKEKRGTRIKKQKGEEEEKQG